MHAHNDVIPGVLLVTGCTSSSYTGTLLSHLRYIKPGMWSWPPLSSPQGLSSGGTSPCDRVQCPYWRILVSHRVLWLVVQRALWPGAPLIGTMRGHRTGAARSQRRQVRALQQSVCGRGVIRRMRTWSTGAAGAGTFGLCTGGASACFCTAALAHDLTPRLFASSFHVRRSCWEVQDPGHA